MSEITVIDSVMGSGKTSWAIQRMNESTDENFLYVTPFLDETERIRSSVNKKDIILPRNLGEGKSANLIDLFKAQGDVATTHELFKRMTKECLETISAGKYTLILDETLDAIQPYFPVKKDDITFLHDREAITIGEDNYLQWNGRDLTTAYDEIKTMSNNNCLFYVNDDVLMWRFPPEIFECFEKVYVMTYLFDGTIMKSYFDLYNIDYTKSCIKNDNGLYTLCNYHKSDNSVFKRNINIYQGRMNTKIRQKQTSFSSSWYNSPYNVNTVVPIIKNNLSNYFKHICKVDSQYKMWTVFKSAKEKLKGKGYTNEFVPCNCRATNEFQDRTALAYCVNLYLNPLIMQFFNKYGIKVDQDKYALSEMLQWIWRSNIRTGGNINLFIQSNRMRKLLIDWLNNEL